MLLERSKLSNYGNQDFNSIMQHSSRQIVKSISKEEVPIQAVKYDKILTKPDKNQFDLD